jgi:oxygen-dependent protoporphyrinogen oxidase
MDVGGPEPRQITVDGVILATPAYHGARLLRDVDESLANDLAQIEYGSCALITCGYRREQIGHPLDGFGVVVPLVERRRILSASFSSIKYPGRVPNGNVLIRTYIGGSCQRELLEMDDGQLLDTAERELTDLLGIEGDPLLTQVSRRVQSMPQYHVGHRSLVQRIMARANQLTGFAIASNSLHGVGIPHCIHTAEMAAQQLLSSCARLKNASSATA